MAELNDELLQTFIAQQAELLSNHRELLGEVHENAHTLKKLRGDMRSIRGKVDQLHGAVESLEGNLLVLGASCDSLEVSAQETTRRLIGIDQTLLGVTQLAKSAFDLNASTLSGIAKLDRSRVKPSESGEVGNPSG